MWHWNMTPSCVAIYFEKAVSSLGLAYRQNFLLFTRCIKSGILDIQILP